MRKLAPDIGDALGHSHSEGVHHGSRVTDAYSKRYYSEPDYRVITHCYSDSDKNRYKGEGLFKNAYCRRGDTQDSDEYRYDDSTRFTLQYPK